MVLCVWAAALLPTGDHPFSGGNFVENLNWSVVVRVEQDTLSQLHPAGAS